MAKGFSELQKHSFSSDLQLNPRRFSKAAEFLQKVPNLAIVINRLGCPMIDDLAFGIGGRRTDRQAIFL